jgi:TRAP-type C4-dicarboxylate transport system permease large subunit
VKAVQDVRDGTFDSSTEEIFRAIIPVLGTLVIAGILAGLGIGVGFLLLIVPGVILLTWWAVIAPVIVVEKKGVMESFGRSKQLVSGHFWTVLGIVVITAILTGVAGGILTVVFSFLPRFLEIFIGSTIAQAIVAPFSAIALTLTYFKLREVKEATTPAVAPPAPEPTA